MKLTGAEQRVLRALSAGWTLKSHRTLDGNKEYKLHPLESEEPQSIDRSTVQTLHERGLVDSNKKFPAATYLLTDKGKELVTRLGQDPDDLPLTARGWE